MNTSILIVTPYEGMYNLTRQIVEEKKLSNIKIVMGDVLTGLEEALEEIQSGQYNLIISRGGTAELLISQTSIPILEIPITTTDIMQALKLSENYDGKVAIVGYRAIINKAKQVCDLMNWHPAIATIENRSKVERVVDQLKEEGHSLVVGDVITTSYCKQIGLESVLISSSKDTLENTINQANLLVHSLHNSKLLTELCYGNQSTSSEFSLIYNHSGHLLLSSLKAVEVQQELLDHIAANFLELSELPYYRQDITINNFHYSLVTKQVTVQDQFYLLIRIKVFDLYATPFPGFRLYDKESLAAKYPTTALSFLGETRALLQKSVDQKEPILLTGERFTGKTSCINYLFLNGKLADHLLYKFDCAKLTLETWYEIVNFFKIRNLTNEVICFINLESANPSILSELQSLLSDPHFRDSNRFLFAYTQTTAYQSTLAEVTEYLFSDTEHITIPLLPLRETSKHLNNLITLYLNDLNTKYGKNVVGLEDQALAVLRAYPWPGNLQQFHRVLKKAVLTSHGYYINESTLMNILAEEAADGYDRPSIAERNHTHINLDQSLNEIIYDIIELTFQECDMNQTKTAEKLNISRSTVWRILKNGKQL